ncbi:MAG: hypothetical protein KF901_22445 [Myxococcales bacterium]|nr:hypothetical protein [Myxococcales bacterium]
MRLGVRFVVNSESVGVFECFASTNDNVRYPGADAPQFPGELSSAAIEQILTKIRRAAELMAPESRKAYHCVLHVKCGGGVEVAEDVSLLGGDVRWYRTVVANSRHKHYERISAVVYKVDASTREHAGQEAAAKHAVVCALASLASHLSFVPFFPSWTKRHPRREFVAANGVDVARLYPRHIALAKPVGSADFVHALTQVVEAFEILSEEDRAEFVPALLSYAGAQEICAKQGTLAVVSFVAALNLLAAGYKEKCPGSISCTVHGSLPWKHDNAGDVVAITQMSIDLLGLNDAAAKSVKALIKDVYSVQRSAFVHGAVMRHGEHDQARVSRGLPGSTGKQFSKLAEYAHDLSSIAFHTRRILLAWLERKAARVFDLGAYTPSDSVRVTTTVDIATYTGPKGVVVRMMPYGDGELARLRAAWLAERDPGSSGT